MAYFTVEVLDRCTQQPLPSIQHNGTTWIVSGPGTEFQVAAKLHNNSHSDHKIFLKIDGVDVGYSKILYRGTNAVTTFPGFLQAQGQANATTYAAFRFGACKPSEDAAVVDNPDDIKAGRILVEGAAVRAVGVQQSCMAALPVRLTDEATKKRLPEGKKFFLAPGLKAEAGGTIAKAENWSNTEYQTVSQLPAVQLRYDTHEALLLRKILNPRMPAHRAILRTCKDPRIARMGAESDEEEASSEQQQPRQQQQQQRRQAGAARVKRENAAAGVKRERDADGAPLPGSATAETVDLTERRPAGPLLVGGRPVGADELAVCDLCDSDGEEPTWEVQKKQATPLD